MERLADYSRQHVRWQAAALFFLIMVVASAAHGANFSCTWTDGNDNWTAAADFATS